MLIENKKKRQETGRLGCGGCAPMVFGNNPIGFNDPLGDKIKNAIGEQVKQQEAKVKTAQKTLDDAQSNHASEKLMRRYNKELKKETNNLNVLKSAMTQVDQMLTDYMAADPEGYKKLDEYQDANGKEIDILITYADYVPADMSASTVRPANKLIVQDAQTGKGGLAWDGTYSGDIKITLYKNNLKINYLANEFGDCDYFDKNVKPNDFKAYDKWSKTANNNYGRYLEDGGAGSESFNYQYRFEKKYYEYLRTKPKVNEK